jgi:hypothetical protein
VLLGAVVDVALQAAPFGVLRLDESLARRAQLLGPCCQLLATCRELRPQPDLTKDQPRLRSEAGEEPFLGARQRPVGMLLQTEHAVDLSGMANGSRPCARARHLGAVLPGIRRCQVGDGAVRPGRRKAQPPVDGQPHLGPGCAGALTEQQRHPLRQVLGRVAAGDRLREVAEHVIGGRGRAVNEPGSCALPPQLHRQEAVGHDRRREDRKGDAG